MRKIILLIVLFTCFVSSLHFVSQVKASSSLSGIHVSGNKLINNSGDTIILRGVNRSGTEYGCVGTTFSDGPTDLASIQAIELWQANVIRVPLNEDCWLGINGVTIGGSTYQQDVVNYVNLITSQGLAVILDLHWNAPGTMKATGQEPMADQDHAPAFWQSVASTFQNNNLVIFDLYNEPDPIPYSSNYPGGFSAWQTADFACVRDGCQATAAQGGSYQTAGMQELLNTVRDAGATNVVIIGGIQQAGTITQYIGSSVTNPSGYMPIDSLNNITVSEHLYNNASCSSQSCWDNTIAPVAQHYPIITGELGDTDCSSTYTSQVLPWLDTHGISYLAWTWDAWSSCQALITDYAGTATSPYGKFYHDYLAALPPTPTIIPTTLSYIILLHGIGNGGDSVNVNGGGNTAPTHTTRPITITMSDTTNTIAATISGTMEYIPAGGNFQGSVTLPSSLPAGVYLISVATPGYLSKTLTQIVTITSQKNTSLPTISLITGDINNDNQLSLLDYNQLLTCYGSKDANCSAADIDDDGVIGPIDYNLFLRELSVQFGN